jgi:hypothetical protein
LGHFEKMATARAKIRAEMDVLTSALGVERNEYMKEINMLMAASAHHLVS